MTFRQFVEVKNFFHAGPPLAFGPRLEWKLHGSNQFPPLLSFWISSHFCHVSFEIGTVIFEVTEQQSVPQVNGIVPDIAAPDHVQNFRPDLRMCFLYSSTASGLTPITEPYRFIETVSWFVVYCGKGKQLN